MDIFDVATGPQAKGSKAHAEALERKLNNVLCPVSADIVIDSLPGLFYMCDMEGKFVRWNQNDLKLTGYTDEEVPSLNALDIISPEHRKLALDKMLEAFNNGVAIAEIDILTKTGEKIPHHVTVKRVSIGEKTYLVGMGIDITDRKKADEALVESEDQLKASLENAPDGVYMNDHKGNFLYVNRKCEEISGYQREEVIGKNFLEVNLIPENDLSRAVELFQDTIKGGSTGSVALELIRKDGRRIPIEIRANVVRYKGQAVMLSFVRDISERKRVESALQESEQSYRRLADYHKQLNDISILFIEAADKQNLFDRIAESFRLLTGAMAATFSLYDQQTRDLKVVSLSIDPVSRQKVDFILGPDLFEMRMPISADVMEQMLSQGIRRLKDLHELSFGVIPRDISDAAMEATGCQQIIGLAISYASELIGACAAYLPGDQPVVPDDALKTYAYISGLAVKRKRSEETLQKTKNIYRLLAENMTDTLWMMDMDLNITWMSPSSVKARGMSLDEIAAIPPDKQATPESFGRAMILFEKMLRIEREERNPTPGAAVSMEMEFYSGGGTTRWFDCTFQFIRDKQGKGTGILAQGRDITERKRAEETLIKTENIYRLLAENISDTVWMMDMDLNITWASPSSAKLRGFSMDEILALPLDRQLTPESLGKAVNLWGKWMHVEQKGRTPDPNGSISIELEFICKDGHTVLLDCALQFIRDEKGKATGILAAGRDITERRQAEQVLRESEAQYRLLSEHMAEGLFLLDMNLKITYISPSVEKIRGFTPLEAMEMPLEKHITPESLKLALEVFSEELPKVESGPNYNPIPMLELEYYCKDGTTAWAENKFSIIRDSSGNPLSILGEIHDITDRRRAEEALRESEAQYRLLSEHTTDTVWLMDMNLKPTYQSPSAEKLRGYTPQEVLDLPLEKQVAPDSLRLALKVFSEELPKMNADPGYNPVIKLDIEYFRKDGTTVWAESNFSLIRDPSGKPISILAEARDITERKLSEEKLEKSYESLKKTFNDAINTMVKIMEMRDPYTAGHQQKVTALATAIAREMELVDTRIDQLKMAAIIHDIGKIYIPSDILSKPGKLSDIEFRLIKTHSRNGYDIVKGMDFPSSAAEAILQHHERLDGSGYPNNLKDDDITLEAKILAVADVVEAMSSHRPYRPALGIDKALEEISKNKGKLYDPDVADVCLKLFTSGKFEFKPV